MFRAQIHEIYMYIKIDVLQTVFNVYWLYDTSYSRLTDVFDKLDKRIMDLENRERTNSKFSWKLKMLGHTPSPQVKLANRFQPFSVRKATKSQNLAPQADRSRFVLQNFDFSPKRFAARTRRRKQTRLTPCFFRTSPQEWARTQVMHFIQNH